LYSSFWIRAVHAAERFISSHPGIPVGECVFLRDQLRSQRFLFEKNAAWRARLGDYSTALEYETSHVLRRIRDGEDNPISLMPRLYEESFRY
jgi:hypothetical protein